MRYRIAALLLIAFCESTQGKFHRTNNDEAVNPPRRESSYLRSASRGSSHRRLKGSKFSGSTAVQHDNGAGSWDGNSAYQQSYSDSGHRPDAMMGPSAPADGQVDSIFGSNPDMYSSKSAPKGSKSSKGSQAGAYFYATKPPAAVPSSPAPTVAPAIPTSRPTAKATFSFPNVPVSNVTTPLPNPPKILPDYSFNKNKSNAPNNATNANSTRTNSTAPLSASSPLGDWRLDFNLQSLETTTLTSAATAQPMVFSLQSSSTSCALNANGFYGNPIGSVYDVSFIYQALLTVNATDAILQSQVAPILDVGVAEALLPYYFSECASRRRRKLQQLVAPTIEGLSRMQTDYLVASSNGKLSASIWICLLDCIARLS
jgi:hypothetical protein